MRILILGVSEGKIARLVQEQHDVTLIDRDPTALRQATDDLDVKDWRELRLSKTLDDADIENSHMLIAVTNSDAVNMLACYNAAAIGRGISLNRPGSGARYSDERLTSSHIFPLI